MTRGGCAELRAVGRGTQVKGWIMATTTVQIGDPGHGGPVPFKHGAATNSEMQPHNRLALIMTQNSMEN